ncbi:MAG: TIGR01777 family oxidoreductase [Pirellulales bacterium]
MRALITGATGFVGRALLTHIEQPVVLSRDARQARAVLGDVEIHAWDPGSGPPPAESFQGVEAVFHLAGESVGQGRWTANKKRRIHESRSLGTTNLVRGIASLAQRPPVLVSASAIGYYGPRGDEILDETALPGGDFLSQVCIDWENAASVARASGVRVVNPRIGIVLGRGGGALAKMLTPFKFGLGGRLASGRQWMSWVHLDDLVGLMLHAVRHPIEGPLNAVAPHSVTNREFTQTLAMVLSRPALLPVPALALRVLLGEFAEALLASQRVVPRVAEQTGFHFFFPELGAALEDAVQSLGHS